MSDEIKWERVEIDKSGPLAANGTTILTTREFLASNINTNTVDYFVEQYMKNLRQEPGWDANQHPTWSEYHCQKVALIEARYRLAVADAILADRHRHVEKPAQKA